MAHRTQITLTDAQYMLLREKSTQDGISLAELIRRAIESVYRGKQSTNLDPQEVLDRTAGIWSDLEETGEEYVERMRPGVGERMRRLGYE